MTQRDTIVIGATRIAVGLSQIIRVVPGNYAYVQTLKIFSGGGTLEIVEPAYSGSSTAASSGWGTGYPVGASEIVPISGPAAFYLAATGATMIAVMTIGRTAGATVL